MLNRTESRQDLLTTNQFRVELNNRQFQDFVIVGGTNRSVTTIENRDGGSGLAEYFSDQTITFAPISLTYRVDPSKREWFDLRRLVTQSIEQGIRHNIVCVKYNHGIEYYRCVYYEVLFTAETFPDLDKNSSAAFDVTMEAYCAGWEVL